MLMHLRCCLTRAFFSLRYNKAHHPYIRRARVLYHIHDMPKTKKYPAAKFEKSSVWHYCNISIHKHAEDYAIEEARKKAHDEGKSFASEQEFKEWILPNMGYLEVYRECYDDVQGCYYSAPSVPCTKCRLKCIECGLKVNCTYREGKDKQLKVFHGFLDAPNAPPSEMSSYDRHLMRQQELASLELPPPLL